jgi:hypothetical protein
MALFLKPIVRSQLWKMIQIVVRQAILQQSGLIA